MPGALSPVTNSGWSFVQRCTWTNRGSRSIFAADELHHAVAAERSLTVINESSLRCAAAMNRRFAIGAADEDATTAIAYLEIRFHYDHDEQNGATR